MVDYFDEIESDLSAFHRVDDWTTLGASRFFTFARLLPVYRGALQAALLRDRGAEPATQAAVSPSGNDVSDFRAFAAIVNRDGNRGVQLGRG